VEQAGEAMFTFRFPNFGYMAVGIVIALCGLVIGTVWNRKKRN